MIYLCNRSVLLSSIGLHLTVAMLLLSIDQQIITIREKVIHDEVQERVNCKLR
jgi:hypothetical protein